ncbi:hypothetical protein ACFY36_03590 [Actinoplanes sp. NPDC000266]
MSIEKTADSTLTDPEVVTAETPRRRLASKAPAAGALAAVGGVIALLLVRRRAARAKSRNRWVPARFQR